MTEFVDLAPRGPLKGSGDRWDVFLSYRSISRPWVLRLYDTLRFLDYEVFMDQFVLTTHDGLQRQLEAGLSRSATGILIWSHQSEDSEWCRHEYEALRSLESSKSGFRFVVANVDQAALPLLARAKLWIDFSTQRDGPTGTDLLRLLYGLHGKPLPALAVTRAAEFDDATRRALARIAAARAAGHHETLIALCQNDQPEWRATSLLRCKVAEALIDIKHPAAAVPLLDEVISAFPRSIRPQQLKGLALARQGLWQAAQQLLGELVALGERDPETLGILARTWRDRFAQSRDRLHLAKARNLYAEAFASAPSDYYTGINAASNSVLLGDLEDAEKYAIAVEALVGNTPVSGDYWKTATIAEVQLIRRNFAQAAKLYAHAVCDDPEAKANHESTFAQARRLIEHLQPTDEERMAIESTFTAGHCP